MRLNNNPEMIVVSRYCLPVYVGSIIISRQKRVSYSYRTALPSTLAAFRPWGSSTGAGRIRLTRCKDTKFFNVTKNLKKKFATLYNYLKPRHALLSSFLMNPIPRCISMPLECLPF